jgi:hypothetical protein
MLFATFGLGDVLAKEAGVSKRHSVVIKEEFHNSQTIPYLR